MSPNVTPRRVTCCLRTASHAVASYPCSMALQRDNLVELGTAATRLMKLADPFASPDDAGPLEDWPYPIPLDWRLQLRYLWVDAADAFDVVS